MNTPPWLVLAVQDGEQTGGSIPLSGTDGGGGAAGNGATGAPGNGTGAPPPRSGGFDPTFLLLFGVIFALIIFTMFGNRKERKKREQMLSALKKHDRVQTVGGVIGSVVDVKSNVVVLKVDESSNTRMTFARSAIQQVLSESDAKKSEQE